MSERKDPLSFSLSHPSRHAREREAVLLAQKAFRTFHVECFWSFDPEMEITITKVDWVLERLGSHGRAAAWKAAEEIQLLLAP
jgi:hypothetical protein